MNCPRVLFGVSHHVLCALLLLLMMPSVQAANDPNRASDLRYMMILGDVGEGERDQIRRVVLAMEDALNDIDEVREPKLRGCPGSLPPKCNLIGRMS